MRFRLISVVGVGVLAVAIVLALAAPALAVDPTGQGLGTSAEEVTHTDFGLNLLWVVMGAVLVIFMQTGFALVETGFCRAKHAAHVVMTNFAIFGLGFIGFFLVGYSLMFGAYSLPVIGYEDAVGGWLLKFGDFGGVLAGGGWALSGNGYDVGVMAFFLYMVAFMDTTATIPTGAMAERWKFKSFILWGLFCGALFYPLYGNWVWGGGWLSQLGNSLSLGHGVVDFAGSGVVHAMGGTAALAGALVLGPRIGKFGPNGEPRTLAGHHIPMAILGTFILLFGWFGFNAASTFAATDLRFTVVAANTAIAGAFGSIAGLLYYARKTGKYDPGMAANGMLGGLVAITAPCAFVQPWAAALIGTLAAPLVVTAIGFFERRRVDDPVGAISVHGVGGLFGVLCVGIFSDGTYGIGWNGTGVDAASGVSGILYGDAGQLVAQLIACGVIAIVGFGMAFSFFKIQNALTKGGIRPTEEDELQGLDIPELGVLGYPEFGVGAPSPATNGHFPEPATVPVGATTATE
ncbi:MAG: ammonium transporter [Actinobacteria bacterium]|nr:ammonium transporter [Actinomycetota bacterium]